MSRWKLKGAKPMPSLINALVDLRATDELYRLHYREKRTKAFLERTLTEPPLRRRINATLGTFATLCAGVLALSWPRLF